MDKKVLRVLARKEVIYAVAGAGASTAAYFAGVRRERKRVLALFTVHNLEMQTTAGNDWSMFGDAVDTLPVKEGLDKIMREYGPLVDDYNYKGLDEFEREAQPLADEILGVIDAVEPPERMELVPEDYEDFENSESPFMMVRNNVFATASSDGRWDMETELASRTPNKPYVIHVDEFIERESDYEQSTLTYFAKDGVVADELNQPMDDWVAVLGALQFGHGSPDANAVYIRNEKLHHEFEVLLVVGSYLEEVLGQEAEIEIEHETLKHSMNMRMRRE